MSAAPMQVDDDDGDEEDMGSGSVVVGGNVVAGTPGANIAIPAPAAAAAAHMTAAPGPMHTTAAAPALAMANAAHVTMPTLAAPLGSAPAAPAAWAPQALPQAPLQPLPMQPALARPLGSQAPLPLAAPALPAAAAPFPAAPFPAATSYPAAASYPAATSYPAAAAPVAAAAPAPVAAPAPLAHVPALTPALSAQRDREHEFGEFLRALDEYAPMVPPPVAAHYMQRGGAATRDARALRLAALAADYFVAHAVHDAQLYHQARLKAAVDPRRKPAKDAPAAGGGVEECLQLSDLAACLRERGITVHEYEPAMPEPTAAEPAKR